MLGWTTLAAALLVFAAKALPGRHAAHNISCFFHVEGRRRNALSLGIADLTLGTGFAYILTASSQFGWTMLALPLGLVAGYFLLARVFASAPPDAMTGSNNLLLAVRNGVGSRRLFDLSVTLPLILVYVLFISYEIFASSQLIAAFVAPDMTAAPAIIGGAIVFVSGASSVAGGMQSNWRNDRLLAGGIGLLFVVVLAASLTAGTGPATTVSGAPLATVAIVTVLGFLAAIATQFYSLLNSYNGSNFSQGSEAARAFRQVGIVIGALLALLVVAGAAFPLDMNKGFSAALGERISGLPLSAEGRGVIIAATIIGMVSVVFSTTDTLTIALAYFIRRHLLGRSTDEKTTMGESVAPTRALVAFIAFGSIPPLALLYLTSPDLFALLLALGGGAAVYAPLVLAAASLLHRPRDLRALRPVLPLFAAMFLGSGVTAAVLGSLDPASVPAASLAWLVAAIAVAGIWRITRHSPAD